MGEIPAIETERLTKSFGATQALSGLDLTVQQGGILGLLGPNGAGKTTAVRVLATLLLPDSGHARVLGADVVRRADDVRRRIGLTGQYAALDDYLTGLANLVMIGRVIAEGTPDKLKAKAGEDRIAVRLAPGSDLPAAVTVVQAETTGRVETDPGQLLITAPIPAREGITTDVVRALDTAGIRVSDVTLRRPSLDDVFLILTGHGAGPGPAPAGSGA